MKNNNFWAIMFAILGLGAVINLILVCNKYNIYKQIASCQDIKSQFQTELFEELNTEINSPLIDSVDYYELKIDSLYNLL
jgi:hypothetical protein